MTTATPPMTMTVSAPMIQAASRSVAASASAVLGARGVVSVTGDANLGWVCAPCPRVSSVPLLFPPAESAPRAATTEQPSTKRKEEKPERDHEDGAEPEGGDGQGTPTTV